ncbi:MAG: (Fe-S)-binding protein [Anaerolineaceae bacterium]|nr:(Fe-S)-binding protein [Anaerolineaceae bacterium]
MNYSKNTNGRSITALSEFKNACIQCDSCLEACSLLNQLAISPGEIAQAVLDGLASKKILETIQRCSLCSLCSQSCAIDLHPSEMMKNSREILVQQGKINLEDFAVMQVDRDWNFFNIYRSTYDIDLNDLKAEKFDTIFFPGCTLASYSPEITRAVYQWLGEQGMHVSLTEICCGKPLSSIGLEERAEKMLYNLQRQIETAEANRIVTACPNCHQILEKYMKNMEVISIFELLVEKDIVLKGNELLTFHDSCMDRFLLNAGKDVRKLLSGYSQVEMKHHGADTICCGSGGIVSMIDPGLCASRAEDRINEFVKSGADQCVTACMACAHRLVKNSEQGKIVHCLELVFGIPVDFNQIAERTRYMWEGEWGEYNRYRLSQAQIIIGENQKC